MGSGAPAKQALQTSWGWMGGGAGAGSGAVPQGKVKMKVLFPFQGAEREERLCQMQWGQWPEAAEVAQGYRPCPCVLPMAQAACP